MKAAGRVNPYTRWYAKAGPAEAIVQISHAVTDQIWATFSGAYGAVIRLGGIDPECRTEEDLVATTQLLQTCIGLLPYDCTVQQILIRRRKTALPKSLHVLTGVAADTLSRRQSHLESRGLGSVDVYWTLCLADKKANRDELVRRLSLLLVSAREVLLALDPRVLDIEEVGQLYAYLSTLDPERLEDPFPWRCGLARTIARSSVQWLHGALLIDGRRYVRPFSMIQRPYVSAANLFGDLQSLDADLVLCCEFQRKDAPTTNKEVAQHQTFYEWFSTSFRSRLGQIGKKSEEAKPEKTAKEKAAERNHSFGLTEVAEDLQHGKGYAVMSLTGFVHSPNPEELHGQLAQVQRIFGQARSAAHIEDLGALSCYCAMFPDSMDCNVRRAWLREDHVARLSLVYRPYTGEPYSDALEASSVLCLETRTRTPFHFDPFLFGGRGLVVLASPGRGKSFFGNLTIDLEAAYGGYIYTFESGNSYEATIRRHGGDMVRFGLDGPRFNPFQLEPTAQNVDSVFRLVRLLLETAGAKLRVEMEDDLARRVRAVFSLPSGMRRLRHLVLAPELQPYLRRWTNDGMYGHAFDAEEDELSIAPVMGFNFESVSGAEFKDLVRPLLFWVRRRIDAVTHDAANLGVPKLELYDELFRLFLLDESLAEQVKGSAKTARKHRGGVMLLSQDASDLGGHSAALLNACPDRLFLGGPFDREQYREQFRLHDGQLDAIEGLQHGEGLLVRPQYSKVVVISVDQFSHDCYSTKAKDRKRRLDYAAQAAQSEGKR